MLRAPLPSSPQPLRRPVAPSLRRFPRAFTLTELLVVMAVIAVLGGITVIAVRGISKDARMASAENTLVAVLDNARAVAMKENRIVLLVLRPRLVGDREQVVEAHLAQWTGESGFNSDGCVRVVDRFVPIPGIPPRPLPRGIKVAGPRYGEDKDDHWATQPHLPAIDQSNPTSSTSEEPGEMLGVMFAPDGTVIYRNSRSDSLRTWFDANGDGLIRHRGIDYPVSDNSVDCGFFFYSIQDDETFVNFSPFLAVFDDDDARERRTNDWTTQNGYEADLTDPAGYIAEFGRRIHFNRYTGVVMTRRRDR